MTSDETSESLIASDMCPLINFSSSSFPLLEESLWTITKLYPTPNL